MGSLNWSEVCRKNGWDIQAQRDRYIAAHPEKEDATWIPLNMFTSQQRAWMRGRGVSVTLWYGQPGFKWVYEGYEWRVRIDTYGWVAGGCQVDTEAYRQGSGTRRVCCSKLERGAGAGEERLRGLLILS